MTQKTGGQLIVECLEKQGVERIFCVPGESYLAVLDALHDSEIDSIVCRQEGGAAMMAEATGKLTGRPGIAMVTRGPGATNASAGVHVAQQDSTPMILFVGQIARNMRGRDAFQEVDYRQMYGDMVKWVAEIDSADRVPEMLNRAYHVAMSGRPGPVVLALPEDMLTETAEVSAGAYVTVADPAPTSADITAAQKLLANAERPIIIAGGSRWDTSSRIALHDFASDQDLPVSVSFRRQMLFDHTHPNYAGDIGIGPNPKLANRIKNADVILLLGGRMSEMPSQSYGLFDIPTPKQKIIHVHPGAEEIGRVYQPALGINATPAAFLSAMKSMKKKPSDAPKIAHDEYLEWSNARPETPGDVQMSGIMQALADELPDDAVITNGAGNYASWIHRFWHFKKWGSQAAPTCGSMGYGLPAAIAAKLNAPDRPVICFAGDGCFQMTSQEFGTAMQFDANIITLVIDNGIYGTIRMHQERDYPARISATEIRNPDFAALAKAYGAHAETVTVTSEFTPALERAMNCGTAALIHIKIDPEAITPLKTLSQFRSGN